MKSIVVYCGSNPGKNPLYLDVAKQTGELLAKMKIKVIYGGGNLGLMGAVADAALKTGGEVVGIIPNFLAQLEVAHATLTEIHFVENMHQRKAQMVALSDGVIALPGGYGTLDELFEILAWSQLKTFSGPVGVLNVNGFYDHLLAHCQKMVDEGFLRPENLKLMLVDTTLEGLLTQMQDFYDNHASNEALSKDLYVIQ